MITNPDNDNNLDGPMVFIIIGKGYEAKGGDGIDLHIMLRAPDDDSAVREALNALSEEGFLEADLDLIVAFLNSLTGKTPEVSYPVLPAETAETPRPVSAIPTSK